MHGLVTILKKISVLNSMEVFKMTNSGKAMFVDDYEKYEELLKKTITRMVTAPDPKDGHTHVVYVDTDGNGMTTNYPEDQESYFSHQHFVVGKKVVLYTDGYGISFHTGLQSMAQHKVFLKEQGEKGKEKEKQEAKKAGKTEESEAKSLSTVFNDAILGGKVSKTIKDEREKESDSRIDQARRALDEEMASKLKKK